MVLRARGNGDLFKHGNLTRTTVLQKLTLLCTYQFTPTFSKSEQTDSPPERHFGIRVRFLYLSETNQNTEANGFFCRLHSKANVRSHFERVVGSDWGAVNV